MRNRRDIWFAMNIITAVLVILGIILGLSSLTGCATTPQDQHITPSTDLGLGQKSAQQAGPVRPGAGDEFAEALKDWRGEK